MVDEKPVAKLLGADGNIFNLVGIASKALKRAGQIEEAEEMQRKVMNAGSYDEALQIIMKYCEVK